MLTASACDDVPMAGGIRSKRELPLEAEKKRLFNRKKNAPSTERKENVAGNLPHSVIPQKYGAAVGKTPLPEQKLKINPTENTAVRTVSPMCGVAAGKTRFPNYKIYIT